MARMRDVAVGFVAAAVLVAPCARAADAGWSAYGGDERGQRFSPAAQITPANVASLQQAWSFSTGDLASKGDVIKRSSFEDTPILAEGRLYVCSPFNEVSALDPGTGRQLWRFDPKLNIEIRYPNDYVCRGVAYSGGRIYLNTADRRLIALDAATGKPVPSFGDDGTVVIPPGEQREGRTKRFGRIHTTSAPVTSHGVVIVGSAIDDNQKVDELRGTVHAFDAMTGAPRWSFDPLGDAKPPFR